jgi:formamidopyrimidine-DNA glycosylase
MPELPEVEASRRLVERRCVGQRVTAVDALERGGGPRDGLFDETVCAGIPDAAALQAALVGRKLAGAGRRGKQMWLELSGPGPALTVHLGMTGQLVVRLPGGEREAVHYKSAKDSVGGAWPPRFAKLQLTLADGTALVLTDPRRFARVTLEAPPVLASPRLAALGPDALLDLGTVITPAWLAAKLAARSVAVKALLLDQHALAGVGNYLADEVLFQARVHPESACDALSPDDVGRLHAALAAVVTHACKVDADYDAFPREWLFHYRWGKGKGASRHGTLDAPIEFVTVGGRTSAVVRSVQGGVKRRGGGGGGSGDGGGGGGGGGGAASAAAAAAAAAASDEPPPAAAAAGKKKRAAPPGAAGPQAAAAAASDEPPPAAAAAGKKKRAAPPGAAGPQAAATAAAPEDPPASKKRRQPAAAAAAAGGAGVTTAAAAAAAVAAARGGGAKRLRSAAPRGAGGT